MDNKFYLVWEDNPDTPITAQNLSKSIDTYSDDDRMLFWDFNDNFLKLKANSKATINVPVTNAMFSFENTLASHSGKFNPTLAENINYRFETTVPGSRSIALESGTTNFLTNPSFESDMTGWTKVENGASVASVYSTALYGQKSMRIKVDNTGNLVSLFQTANQLGSGDVSSSVSFYYKGSAPINLLIIGYQDSIPKYWRPFGANKNQWENLESVATIVVPASNDWIRYEVNGINTGTIKSIQLKWYSNEPGAEYYLDGVQLENKPYCTSFTPSVRDQTKLVYPKSILSLDEGSIDLIVEPKYLNQGNVNTIFVVPTISYDAFKLTIDRTLGQNLLIFSIYDTVSASQVQASINLEEDANFINKNIRIICNWKTNTGISLYAKYVGTNTAIKVTQNATNFIPSKDALSFDVGAKYSGSGYVADEVFEGLIDKIKINNFTVSNTDITNNIDEYISADSNIYRLFENSNFDMVLLPTLLDAGSAFVPNKNYYVWICEVSGFDSCDVVISQNDVIPLGKDINTSRIIGGFRTDQNGLVDERTIWDLVSKYKNLLVERFVTFNPKSGVVTSEVSNTPTDSLITYNAPIVSNRENIFNALDTFNGASIFNGNVTVTSKIEVDQLRLMDNVLCGINSDVVITNSLDKNISVVSSPTGKINLDKVFFKDNILTTYSGYDLVFTTATGTAGKITLNAASGANNVESQSNVYISNDKILYFNGLYRQFINLGLDASSGIGVQASTAYMRTSKNFAWFKGGSHSNTQNTPGSGGVILAALSDGELLTGISPDSRFYAGRIHNAIYNDLAECWLRDAHYPIEYSMVAIQTIFGARSSRSRAEKGTIGIVSDSYGFLLNDEGFKTDLKLSPKIPICIAGRAKVVVVGKNIEIGDEVVSYVDGTAIKASWFEKIFKRDRILGQVDSDVKDTNLYWIKVK